MGGRNRTWLFGADAVERALKRIAHEILERDPARPRYCLVGIRRRGLPLAELIAQHLRELSTAEVCVGEIDISLYRDDLSKISEDPRVDTPTLPFELDGNLVILVDDVLFTGRTVRAALDALMELGRPSAIRLAVLIDRGHRELPIRADYVGKNIPTSATDRVEVLVPEYDRQLGVYLDQEEK